MSLINNVDREDWVDHVGGDDVEGDDGCDNETDVGRGDNNDVDKVIVTLYWWWQGWWQRWWWWQLMAKSYF